MSTILFGVLGLVTGLLGSVWSLVAATCGAVAWGLIGGWMAQHALGHSALRVLIVLVTLQAGFLAGLAARTGAGR